MPYITQAHHITVTFDSLFPMSYYQKGLEASLWVWQSLLYSFERNDGSQLPYDGLLAKLALTQLYVSKMKQQEASYTSDDKDYFVMVVNKIKDLIGAIVVADDNEDFVLCAQGMILNIQQQI